MLIHIEGLTRVFIHRHFGRGFRKCLFILFQIMHLNHYRIALLSFIVTSKYFQLPLTCSLFGPYHISVINALYNTLYSMITPNMLLGMYMYALSQYPCEVQQITVATLYDVSLRCNWFGKGLHWLGAVSIYSVGSALYGL